MHFHRIKKNKELADEFYIRIKEKNLHSKKQLINFQELLIKNQKLK